VTFEKNEALDEFLQQLNRALLPAEDLLRDEARTLEKSFPTVIKIGLPRTGGTLLTQWALATGTFYLPSNLLSRFFLTPSVGALIVKLISDPSLDYRDEFIDVNRAISFSSEIGKTKGLLAPHEFWYFWRNHLHLPDVPTSLTEFEQRSDFSRFNLSIRSIQAISGRPLFLKGHLVNFYLPVIESRAENFLYLHLRRDLGAVALSLYKARVKWQGSVDRWFSHKPRQYDMIKDLSPEHQVAGQVYFIEKEIEDAKDLLGDRHVTIDYHTLCKDPKGTFEALHRQISKYSRVDVPGRYEGPESFQPSEPADSHVLAKLKKAIETFYDRFGSLEISI
jgi:hypothetical protein